MNSALWFLTWKLYSRSLKQWFIRLRQPGRLVGTACLGAALWSLYAFRHSDFISGLIRTTPLSVVVAFAFFLSIARGLLHRGLRFDPPDVEFVCSGPFTERSILLFRLLPSYVASVLTSVFVYLFLSDQFLRPVLASVCVGLVQVLSAHLTTLASLWAGTLTVDSLRAVRRGLWSLGVIGILILFRSIVQTEGRETVRSPWESLLVNVGAWPMMNASSLLEFSSRMGSQSAGLQQSVLIGGEGLTLWILGCVLLLSVGGTFSRIMSVRGSLFLPSLNPLPVAGSGQSHQRELSRFGGSLIPNQWLKRDCFVGWLAIFWKNMICVRRSTPRLLMALFYSLLVVLPWLSIFLLMRQSNSFDPWAVNGALPLSLAALPLILQTTVPFDFRLDGHQLIQVKRLPLGSLQTVLGVVAVPISMSVLFQYAALLVFLPIVPFDPGILLAMVLGFPAVSVGVSVVWNLHYLLFAMQRYSGQGKAKKRTTVGALLVAGIAFAVFFPSCWLLHRLVNVSGVSGMLSAFIALITQYLIDGLLIWMLVRVYERASFASGEEGR